MAELKDHTESEILCPLIRLPTEIIQQIACFLPNDYDLISFSLTCFHLAEMILPAESTVWRSRFRDLYDTPRDRSSLELKHEYKIRAIVLSQKISFSHGEHDGQTLWLKVMQNMLLESLSLPSENKQSTSKTFDHIRRVLFESDFLNRPVSGYSKTELPPPSDLFCAVQLCLTDLALDPSMSIRCRRGDYDVGKVYSYQTDISEPLVDIKKPNLEAILHIRNFWLRHLMNPDEATFHSSFTKLPEGHRPKGRREVSLEEDSNIRAHWLGYNSCIHPYPETLADFGERQTCADLDTHLTQVEPMSLQIKPHPDPTNWPVLFDQIIPILGASADSIYFRGIQKTHGINDDSTNLIRGFIEPIIHQQGGFPVWKRICFAIYKPNSMNLGSSENSTGEEAGDGGKIPWFPNELWPPCDLQSDFTSINGYEGVMLPGERIIMGRFVDMIQTSDRGPFVFWDF